MKKTRKPLSIIIVIALALMLTPAWAITASAATVDTPLDFTAMATTDNLSADGWAWDQETLTLTLDGFDFNRTRLNSEPYAAILLPDGATIALKNENDITATDFAYGVEALGDLTVTGPGGVTVNAGLNSGAWVRAIYVEGDLMIEGGAVSVSVTGSSSGGACYGILSDGNTAISGAAVSVNANDGAYGIYAGSGDIAIDGGTVDVAAESSGIYAGSGGIEIKGGANVAVTVKSLFFPGIQAYSDVSIKDSAIKVDTAQNDPGDYNRIGISAYNVTIDNSSVDINSGGEGIGASNEVSINGDVNIVSGLDGIGADSIAFNGGGGTIRTLDQSGDYWAVYAYDSLAAGSGISVMGWEGAAYTLAAEAGDYDYYYDPIDNPDDYDTYMTFLNAGEPLANIWYGPEYSLKSVAGVALSPTGFSYDAATHLISASINVPNGKASIGAGDIGTAAGIDYMAFDIYLPFDLMNNQSYDVAAILAGMKAGFGTGDGALLLAEFTDMFGLDITDSIPLKAGGATDVYILATDNDYFKITVNRAASGGNTGGGGGGSSSPSTIPAVGGAVSVDYSKSGGAVTLDLPAGKVNEIIGASKGGTASFDLSKVSGAANATVPATALKQLAGAGLNVEIKLPAGSLTLDPDAAKSVAQQANGENISLELKQLKVSDLNDAQKNAVKGSDIIIDINIYSGSQKITTLNGELTVAISPYNGPLPPAVWYLNEAGDLEKIPCAYDSATKTVTFATDHLSIYVLGAETDQTASANPFTDVSESAWYYGDVMFAYENGLMNGTAADKFSPDKTLTRGMLVTALWRLRGEPMLADFQNPYGDVDWQKYYFNAVLWATASKIITGYGDGNFGPDSPVTRQDLAVILMRYMNYREINLPVTEQWIIFGDESNISGYAIDAIQTLNKLGVINGTGANSGGQTIINPKGDATRAQAAAMLHRFIAVIGGE